MSGVLWVGILIYRHIKSEPRQVPTYATLGLMCVFMSIVLLLDSLGHLFYWLTVNKLINFNDQTPSLCLSLPLLSSSAVCHIFGHAIVSRGIVWGTGSLIKSSRPSTKNLFTTPGMVLGPPQLNHRQTISSRALIAPATMTAIKTMFLLRALIWTRTSYRHGSQSGLQKFNGFTNTHKVVNNVISISGYSNL